MIGHSAFSSMERTIYSESAPTGVMSQANLELGGIGSYETSKRITDVVGSVALLALGAPLLALLAIGVKLSSPGPILFSQRRLGKGGRIFHCLKFRTMVVDAESKLIQNRDMTAEFATNFKIKNDPRVTRLGALLRRTSLDELPQLWNVLRGEMSLIGPRPIVERELSKYGSHGEKLLTVKPGLGGLWQVSGRSDTTYHERIAMDMTYIESRSLAMDLRLIVQTAMVVILGRGAY
ncbi:MAG: sugar transferase [Isosphaeraceae bacterium]